MSNKRPLPLAALIAAALVVGTLVFMVVSYIKQGEHTARGPLRLVGADVANVNGVRITRQQFDHWYRLYPLTTGTYSYLPEPDPPRFSKCVRARRAQSGYAYDNEGGWTRAYPFESCKRDYEQARDSVMKLLISTEWYRQAREDAGNEVSDDEAPAGIRGYEEADNYSTSLDVVSTADLKYLVKRRIMIGEDGPDNSSAIPELIPTDRYDDRHDGDPGLTDMAATWRSKTICAPRYVIYLCSNGPKREREDEYHHGGDWNRLLPSQDGE